ncbi:formate dehydrogenase subunit gamma [Pseudorhodoferax aquiterrae]|uniref:Formate dehydrogenase subunit gamma n=1 Tax=Pseudorhodoferax aquiterrae TaxID=747304 RepID=A0ABQ3G672_9BURK|nr:formate dehydrogenase subunit gamma [Pseudorhodoferax aquiterrae]GHC92808.1 formate dehydrogenase subunit gamma [Pseudorhodoferax aquiterrae]
MNKALSRWIAVALLGAASAWAQAPDPAAPPAAAPATAPAATASNGPPPGFVAPAEPQADDSNAARAKSQPGNNAPFWRGVRNSGETAGVTQVQGLETGVLIQRFERYPGVDYATAGEAWRQVRNRFIIPYGGALMLIALVAIALFYFGRGTMGHASAEGGRRIERFTPFERAAHWLNAIAFVLLGISGIVMAFGKFLLLPWMGHTVFGLVTYWLKTLHNFVGPLFAVSLLVIFFTFVKDNLPRREDWTWVKKAGGMFSGHEVPSHRFNAGEKGIFWGGVFVLGLTVVLSGLVLDHLVPNLPYTRGTMQIAHMFHATGAVLMLCAFFGHIYLGTLGMRGAYTAMRKGYVSEAWAQEHHALWYEDIRAGRIPAQRSGEPAAKDALPQARQA